MEYVKSFRELEVYKLSRQLSREIFELSKKFPKEEMYSLTDQIRRSSRSTGAQIAEAWAKRKYEKHFVSKLTDADGEQQETQHWIETALDCSYISKEISENLLKNYASIGKMLNSMISKSESFCSPQPITDNRLHLPLVTSFMFNKSKNYLFLHLVVFIWGFTGIFGRAITLPTTQLIWYRLFLSSAAILIYLLIKGIPLKVSRNELLKFMAIGLLIALHWICFYGAIKTSNVSVTLACFSSGALFTAILEPLFFKKKINRIEIVCGMLVIIAISMIFSFEAKYKTGMLLSVFAALTSAIFTILNAAVVRTSDSRVMSYYELAFGLLGISVFLLLTENFSSTFFTISSINWWLLLLFSIVGTAFTFVVSAELLKEISPYTVNLTVNLEVVYGIILAYFIFGEDERMTIGFYVATFIILLVLFANAWLKQKQRRPL